MKTLHVVAALIRDESNRILIAQRAEDDTMPLFWEFPGGKVEDGESLSTAIQRELIEELGIKSQTGKLLFSEELSNHHRKIMVHFIEILSFSETIVRHVHRQLEWCNIDDLKKFNFLPADKNFIQLLQNGKFS